MSATQTLFDAGRTRANVDFAKAGYDASVATYRRTVLTAMQEVEDGITGVASLDRATAQANVAVASAQRVLDMSNARYEGGVADLPRRDHRAAVAADRAAAGRAARRPAPDRGDGAGEGAGRRLGRQAELAGRPIPEPRIRQRRLGRQQRIAHLQHAPLVQPRALQVGGGEFVVLSTDPGLDKADATNNATLIAGKIHSSLAEPCVIDGVRCACSANVGLQLFSGDEHDAEAVLKQADAAMYEDKKAPRASSVA